jgi:hypothetical protein
MSVKIIFDKKTGALYVPNSGYEGVDKRIDVFATALRAKKTLMSKQVLSLLMLRPFLAKDPLICGVCCRQHSSQ